MKYGSTEVVRTKFSSLDGQTKVSYAADQFMAVATKAGVELEGDLTITTREELDQFAAVIGAAWTEHDGMVKSIRKELQATASGH